MRIEATALANDLIDYDPLILGIGPGKSVTVDFTTFDGEAVEVAARAESWLHRLPCPSIALTTMPMRLKGFDLSVSSPAEAERLEAAAANNPVASTVLVQALRVIEGLPLQAGLVVESLAFAALQQGHEFQDWLSRLPPSDSTLPPPAPDAPPLLVKQDGDVMAILLNRPATRNAIDVAMRDALFEAFSLAVMSTDIARIDVRGAGDSFSIGGALSEFGQVASGASAHLIRTERLPARMLADHGHKFHFHLHGAVVGAGLEIAAFGGRITATPDTFIRLPEIGMGLIPGAGGCVSVTRRLGRQGAALLIMTGARISARTALRLGLIDEIGD
jgi:hypothetical protein